MARSRRNPVRVDRRGDPRIVLRRRIIVTLTILPEIDNAPAVVFDISCKGIGLLVDDPVDAGARIALAWEHRPGRVQRTIDATVVHAMPARDGSWRIGCTFDMALEASDLRKFLRRARR